MFESCRELIVVVCADLARGRVWRTASL